MKTQKSDEKCLKTPVFPDFRLFSCLKNPMRNICLLKLLEKNFLRPPENDFLWKKVKFKVKSGKKTEKYAKMSSNLRNQGFKTLNLFLSYSGVKIIVNDYF